MKLMRKRIRELIMNFFDHAPRLSDKQVVFAVRVIAKSASPNVIMQQRRELTKAGRLVRSNHVKREANGRLVNLYENAAARRKSNRPSPSSFVRVF